MASRTVSLFPTRSPEGLSMATDLAEILRTRLGVAVQLFDRSSRSVSEQDVITACLTNDLVVFDATREEDTNNFDIANDLLKYLPNTRVVSRNYLPENFFGYARDFYPSYLEDTKNREQIVAAISSNLDGLLANARTVADAQIRYANRIEIDITKFRKRRGGAFISFRGRYETHNESDYSHQYRYSVRELADRIALGAYSQPQLVSLVTSGALVYENELLTEQRRWYLLRQISEQYIAEADELWIYGAPDHFGSWWTIGEFAVSLLRGRMTCLRVYDPARDAVTTIDFKCLPRLDMITTSHLGHRLMDENRSVAADYARIASVWRWLAVFVRNRLTKSLFKLLLKPLYGRALEQGGLTEDIPYDEFFELIGTRYYHESVVGRSFTREFWEQPEILLENDTMDGRSAGDRLNLSVDFNRLSEFSGYQRIAVSKEEIGNGSMRAGERAYVLRPEKPRFQFAPSIRGKDYSSTGANLETIPVVRFWNE